MRRLRRAVNRLLRAAGPGLLLAGAVCVVGLGLHAADDWHHHGEMGAGFFHLHFHVGNHDHPDLEHSRADDAHHSRAGHDSAAAHPVGNDSSARRSGHHSPDNGRPAPADDSRNVHAVLTVPHAVKHQCDAAPTIELRAAPLGSAVTTDVLLPRTSWRSRTADPRGPPA